MITIADIEAARERIAPWVRHTPVLEVSQIKTALPAQARVSLKLELLQVTGSFKARGAMNRFKGKSGEVVRSLTTASGGNHGLAVARTAFAAGVPATIFVPDITSPAKAEMIRNCGATLVFAGSRYADALAASEAHIAKSGAMPIHAFDQAETLLGQGTVGLELEQHPDDAAKVGERRRDDLHAPADAEPLEVRERCHRGVA